MLEKEFVKLCDTYERIIIYGAGMVGKLVYKRLVSYHLDERVLSFAVSHDVLESEEVQRKAVNQISSLAEEKEDALVIIATLPSSHQAIEWTLKQLEFKNIVKIEDELFEDLAEKYIEDFRDSKELAAGKIDVLLMASDNNASSGAFLCMADLSEELNRKGLCTCIILPTYGDGEEVLVKKGLNYTYIPSKNWVYPVEQLKMCDFTNIHRENQNALEELKQICQEHQVRLIHNNTTYTYIGAVVARQLNIPIVWHIREDISVQGCDFIDRQKSLSFINESDKIIVVSNFIKESIKGLYPEKTQVIYDGVDVERYYIERDILEQENHARIIMVGAITPYKGQRELIEALHLLEKKHMDILEVQFLGKGDESYLEELHQLIDAYGLNDIVQFLGMRSDVAKYYKAADIAIVCSQADSFGRVTVEAQLAGCVVIGADAGATSELIMDKQTGFLYECGNASHLAETIKYLLSNKAIIQKIASEGQKIVAGIYTKQRNTEEILEEYQKVLSKRS